MRRLGRMILILTFTLLSGSLLSHTASAIAGSEIAVHGDIELSIKPKSGWMSINGGTFSGATLKRQNSAVILSSASGEEIGRAEKSQSGEVALSRGKTLALTLVSDDQGYRIFTAGKVLKNRVKVKEDKFNLYDADGTRLLHGKQKLDGWGVKDEGGKQTLKIKGPASLKEASYFALPIDVALRIVAWAIENP